MLRRRFRCLIARGSASSMRKDSGICTGVRIARGMVSTFMGENGVDIFGLGLKILRWEQFTCYVGTLYTLTRKQIPSRSYCAHRTGLWHSPPPLCMTPPGEKIRICSNRVTYTILWKNVQIVPLSIPVLSTTELFVLSPKTDKLYLDNIHPPFMIPNTLRAREEF